MQSFNLRGSAILGLGLVHTYVAVSATYPPTLPYIRMICRLENSQEYDFQLMRYEKSFLLPMVIRSLARGSSTVSRERLSIRYGVEIRDANIQGTLLYFVLLHKYGV